MIWRMQTGVIVAWSEEEGDFRRCGSGMGGTDGGEMVRSLEMWIRVCRSVVKCGSVTSGVGRWEIRVKVLEAGTAGCMGS